MTMQRATCKCYHCDKTVTFHYEPVDHLQHLKITLFTLGIWFPIWFFDIVAKTKICDVCGKPAKE